MQLADRLIKERHGCDAPTKAAMWGPHAELETCVRAYVTGSTVGAELGEADRLNHFPASSTCAIKWFIQGDYAHVNPAGDVINIASSRPVMFTGPHTLFYIGRTVLKVVLRCMHKDEARDKQTAVFMLGQGCPYLFSIALAVDQLHWADVAAAMGFSDQAHLSRKFRRITGLSPRQFKDVLTMESCWMYQIWT